MREGRFAEVSRLEQPGDFLQVLSDRLKVSVIARLLHRHLDGAAVVVQQEVMNRAFLIEAHGLGPALEHVAVMGLVIVRLPLLWLLRPCRGRQPRGGCGDGDQLPKSMRHICLQRDDVEDLAIILNPGIVPGSRHESPVSGTGVMDHEHIRPTRKAIGV